MKALLRYWESVRTAGHAIDTVSRTDEQSRVLREHEAFQQLALATPRRSMVAAAEAARRRALLDDLVENDDTFKSFEHFKAWRAELAVTAPQE